MGLALGLLPALGGALEASPAASVRVDGALPRTGTLGQADLEKLGATTLSWTSHGQTHQVTGVRVDKVLVHFGFTPGAMGKDVPVKEKVKGYRQVLVATARDGFQASFSCAEVTEGMGTTVALIAWQLDGKALGPEAGPLRIVVTTDGEPARSIRQLERLHVIDVN
jgi:DMSO/TMAO reductase YedYZ molybdopterin-dependent catalytic subunit